MDIIKDLKKRGLVHQITDEEGLRQQLNNGPVTLYCGFDPTADSLHVGNLLAILTLKRFQVAGHRPIALVGGGTGLIGDPSGRSSERSLNEDNVVEEWANKIKEQLSKLLDFSDKENGAKLVNNYDWLSGMRVIEFLRDVGKHFGVNYMLAKESVEARIERGISFTEFSYMILQSWDFLNLYREHGCSLQIGGSDQWGNITAGLELIRKTNATEEDKAFGLTIPLITKADGTKFGKTAGGAIWLDPEKTTPYEFYQFWINADDRDVLRFLHFFTFLSEEEMAILEKQVEERPEERAAQKRLAEEVTRLVHGEEALAQAKKITESLFSGNLADLTASDIRVGFKDVPSVKIEDSEMNLVDLLVESKIVSSKRQAREDIQNGAIYINGERNQDFQHVWNDGDRIEGMYTIIRRGKKKYFLIEH
ncbi:tyrosine--tRNA ligase [Bacillaceae bacterium S4-13-56]